MQLDVERIQEIDAQAPELLARHRRLQRGLLSIYLAIFVFVGDMFVIAIAEALGSAPVSQAALVVFLVGTAVLISAVVAASLDIRIAHRALEYEVTRVLILSAKQTRRHRHRESA